MKRLLKKIIALALLSILCSFPVSGQTTVELDEAIQQASSNISEITRPFLPVGIIPISFHSPTDELSAYVLREMSLSLERVRLATIIPRQEIDLVLRNANLSASSNVTDTAAVQLSQSFLGRVSFAVTGTFERVVDTYRFRIRLINLHTGRLASATTIDVRETPHLRQLLGLDRPAPAAAATPAPAQARPVTPAPSAAIANGTYTLWPRPRAMQSGMDVDVYIDRIVVRGGYFNIYFVGSPTGRGNQPMGIQSERWSGFHGYNRFIIQDLDNPRRSWNPVSSGSDNNVSGGVFHSFQGITARRFSYTNNTFDPPLVFDEIILPDQPD